MLSHNYTWFPCINKRLLTHTSPQPQQAISSWTYLFIYHFFENCFYYKHILIVCIERILLREVVCLCENHRTPQTTASFMLTNVSPSRVICQEESKANLDYLCRGHLSGESLYYHQRCSCLSPNNIMGFWYFILNHSWDHGYQRSLHRSALIRDASRSATTVQIGPPILHFI